MPLTILTLFGLSYGRFAQFMGLEMSVSRSWAVSVMVWCHFQLWILVLLGGSDGDNCIFGEEWQWQWSL